MTTKEGYPPVSRENRRWEDGGFLTWRICMVAFLVLSYNQLALWIFWSEEVSKKLGGSKVEKVPDKEWSE